MESYSVYSRCPVEGPIQKIFAQYVEIGGAMKKTEFTKDILWLIESHTFFTLIHGHSTIAKLGTTSDFYGFLKSFKLHNETFEYIQSYELIKGSTLKLEATVEVFKTAVIDTIQSEFAYKSTHEYKAIPKNWIDVEKITKERPHPCIDNETIFVKKYIVDPEDPDQWIHQAEIDTKDIYEKFAKLIPENCR